MGAVRAFLSRLNEPLIREHDKECLENDLALELDTHLQMLIDDNLRTGMGAEEARRRARISLGVPECVKENCRDARGARWLTDLLRDLRYAFRALRQKPTFSAVAILTLALGIGATTVMFTVIDGVLFRPLPYPAPDRLVSLNEWTGKATQFGNLQAFSYPNFVDSRRASRSLDMAAWGYQSGTVSKPGIAAHVDGFQISSELFSVFGISLARGRAFNSSDDRAGAPPVAIISFALWQSRFGGSPAAIGSTLIFEQKPYTVIGIVPADFRLSQEADLYFPVGQNTEPVMQNRFVHRVLAVGRLRPGFTLAQAQTELALVGTNLAEQYPRSNAGRSIVAAPLRPDIGDVRPTLWLLLGAVSLVLLIACVNVASLLLARAVSREREIAMRVALGAGRSRLIRQCLTESAVLALSGGVLGLLLAAASLRPFIVFWPGSLPRAEAVHLDSHVMLFALASALLSGLLFGLAPALRAPARDLEQALRSGARSVIGTSRRLHKGFVMSEIALAVVLLVSAGMLGRTLLRLSSLDPGIDVRNVLVTRAALSPAVLSNPAQIRAAWKSLLDNIRRMPEVQSVATVDTVPMREGNNQLGYWPTAAVPPQNEQPLALATSVTPDYLNVMGIPLRAGRFFNDQDRLDSTAVIVIDDVLAKSAFGSVSVVGRRLWIPNMAEGPLLIVGVVGHVRHWGLANDDQAQIRAQVYYPFAQVPDVLMRRWSELMSIAVRTRVEPSTLIEPLRRIVNSSGGDQVLYEERTMEQLAARTLARQRFLMLLFGLFAGLALLLASIGIYGVLAYLTSQRVPEVGVRMALGASGRDVIQLVLRQSVGMIFGGVVVGVAAATAAGRLLNRFVGGMQSSEPALSQSITFAAMVAVLVAAALFASFLPARRASRIDPMNALRQE